MTAEKLNPDSSYQELASALADRIKSQDPTLWNRWVEIEGSRKGIDDIWNEVLRHVRNNIGALSSRQIPKLIMEMRGIAYREARRRE